MLKSGAEFAGLLDDANFAQKASIWGVHYDHILHGFEKPSIVHLFTSITKFIEGGRQKTHLIQNRQQEKRSNVLDSKKTCWQI